MTDLNKTVQDPNKEFFNAEFRFLKADRTIVYVQHRGIFIRDANGKAIRALGAMTDITDALERLHKLELQNKALTDIAWTQSHLVRAPLANLLGLTDILKNNLHKEISQTEIINHLYNSAQQLDAVIHDIVKKTNEDKYRTIGFGYYPLQQ
jgi:signal transduction histidine kinase